MKKIIIGNNKDTKTLAVELAIKCIIPVVVKSFYCHEDKWTTNSDKCNEQCKYCISLGR